MPRGKQRFFVTGTDTAAGKTLITAALLEKAGLIWVTLDPNSTLDINDFLCGYDGLLNEFGFADWHHQHTQTVEGPNWKIAYDGYLDYYHLPILHKETFGTEIGNKANYYSWGPHTRLGRPDTFWAEYEDRPAEEWPSPELVGGVWTIFPHVSIASFAGGGRSVMISQLFPGDTPETSYTNQIFLMAHFVADGSCHRGLSTTRPQCWGTASRATRRSETI